MRQIAPFVLGLLFFCCSKHLQAQQINEQGSGVQRAPSVAASESMVVFAYVERRGEGTTEQIFVRTYQDGFFNVVPLVINADHIKDQRDPSVAIATNGAFVVTWTAVTNDHMLDVYLQWFGDDGMPQHDAIRVNSTQTFSQAAPDVAVNANGEAVVVWHSWEQDGGDRGVYLRRFAQSGQPLSEELLVNETTAYSQCHPAIALGPNGGAVVWATWAEGAQGAWSYEVDARQLDANGVPVGPEIRVNTETRNNQWHADVAVDELGDWAVVWTSWGEDGDEGGVYVRTYASDGTPTMMPDRVNNETVGYQWLPSVGMRSIDDILITWSSWGQDGSREGVFAERWNQGTWLGVDVAVNTYTEDYQWEPALALNADEAYVAWSSWGEDGDDYGVYFTALGALSVNTVTEWHPNAPFFVGGSYPNPFDESGLTITIETDAVGLMRVEILDLLGKRIYLDDVTLSSTGAYTYHWDGRNIMGRELASGLYFIRLIHAQSTQTVPVIKR